jgi:hypothetical protein
MPESVIKRIAIPIVAFTIAIVLVAPAMLTTGVLAASPKDKDCKDIQFHTYESTRAITIQTSQNQYSVEVDYNKDTGGFEPNPYFKNIAADDPAGNVVLPGGETITITLQSVDDINSFGTRVTLYNNKISDCQILLGHTKTKDKVDFEFISAQPIDELGTVQLTVRVPDASDIGKDFTKLAVQFPSNPEQIEYYLISDRVQIT